MNIIVRNTHVTPNLSQQVGFRLKNFFSLAQISAVCKIIINISILQAFNTPINHIKQVSLLLKHPNQILLQNIEEKNVFIINKNRL